MGPPGGGGYGGAPPFAGGRTPAPNFANGRTPAPNYSGGRTPAPNMFGGGATPAGGAFGGGATPRAGGAFDPSGRTPNPWSADSRTPFHRPGQDDAFNPSSRTPFHPGMGGAQAGPSGATPNPYNAPPPPGVAAAQTAWNSSSRTPYGGAAGNRTPFGGANDGGKTPDPRRATAGGGRTPGYGGAGGRTPAYGAKNGYSAPTPAAMSAPTPAANGGASGWEDDEWGVAPNSAPTPAASVSFPSALSSLCDSILIELPDLLSAWKRILGSYTLHSAYTLHRSYSCRERSSNARRLSFWTYTCRFCSNSGCWIVVSNPRSLRWCRNSSCRTA